MFAHFEHVCAQGNLLMYARNSVKHVPQYRPSYSMRYMMKESSNSYVVFCSQNSLMKFHHGVYEIRVLRCIDHRLELPRPRSFRQSCYGFLSCMTDAFVIKPKLQCFVHS